MSEDWTSPYNLYDRHSTRTLAEFMSLIEEVQADLVVDVRSMTNPQFNLDVLPEALAAAETGYRHLLALGGRRHRPKSVMPSSNTLWRNSSFQTMPITPRPTHSAMD